MSELLRPLISRLADGRFHSGTELGEALAISRAAVWKHMQQLSELGLEVHSVRSKGYRLPEPVCLLERASIRAAITKEMLPGLGQLEILDAIDSTNSYAMRRLQEGTLPLVAGKHAVILAEQQTQGKGRRGRLWVSPYGRNIYMTMVRLVDTGTTGTEGISLVVGLALIRALSALGVPAPGVKWPNDVVAGGKKLAGILLEISGDITGVCQLLIGVGINVRCPPGAMQDVGQPWTDCHSLCNREIDRNVLVGSVASHIMAALPEFEKHGLPAFHEEWRQHDVMLGREVELSTASGSRIGKAMGIADNGALILDTGQGVQLFNGGEISLRSLNP